MKNAVLQTLTDSQRTFVTAAESAGARSPAAARTTGELPRISARELEQLLDMGIVRESAGGSFYIYDRARPAPALEAAPFPLAATTRRRRIVKMVIVLLLLSFPILLMIVLRLANAGP